MKEDNIVLRYSKWVVRHPWIILLLAVICVPMLANGVKYLSMTTSYRVFFSDDNPWLMAFDELQSNYTQNDNVLFVLSPKNGEVFSKNTLQAIQTLTEKAWNIPYSIRVDSITNFQYTEADGDQLIVRELAGNDATLNTAGLKKIEQVAESEPLLVNRLVSEDGHVAGVNVIVQLPGVNMATENPEVATYSRELADEIRQAFPDIEVRLTGMVLLNYAFAEASQKDMQTIIPLSFLLMVVLLLILTRSITGTLSTVIIIFSSIFVALGVGGYLGLPITPPSASSPTIILTVAIANCVHILVTFIQKMQRGMEKKEAIVESMRINFQPVFLASITTAIGFLSMLFSPVPPYNHLGIMVSVGVITSFIMAVSVLPSLLTLLPIRIRERQSRIDDMWDNFADIIIQKRKEILIGLSLVIVIFVSFLPKNELNDVYTKYFSESTSFRQDSDYTIKHLTGFYVVDYSLSSGESGGISKTAFLHDVDAFEQWFREQPETIHVNSITDIIKRLNKNMHGDDEAYYKIPDNKELVAQYLLLYEMSLPYGLDLNNQINIDKSATRFTVTLKTLSSNELLALEDRAQQWLIANAKNIEPVDGSGTIMMFSHIGRTNIISMLTGTTVALFLISMVLIFALRSFKIGFLSLIPNLVPAAIGFGLWGIFVGEIGLGLSVVAGMTLGIVVDDTVHFLSKYLRARREIGLSADESIRYTYKTVGTAIVFTSVILVAGFLVLSISSFKMNSAMGLLTAVVIGIALLADLIFLPALLMKLEEKKENEYIDVNAAAPAKSSSV